MDFSFFFFQHAEPDFVRDLVSPWFDGKEKISKKNYVTTHIKDVSILIPVASQQVNSHIHIHNIHIHSL